MDIIDWLFGDLSYITLTVLLILTLIFLAKYVGKYPDPLPRSDNPKRVTIEVLTFTGLVFLWLAFAIFYLVPTLLLIMYNPYTLTIILSSIFWFLIPLVYIVFRNKWRLKDLGITTKLQSHSIFIVSVFIYLLLGVYSFFRLEPREVYWLDLIILIYSNAFLEEFLFRGIIQNKLERTIGQKKALIYQAILFTIIHIPANLMGYSKDGNLPLLFWYFGFQFIHGIIYGIIFMKTRNLLPAVICHYLTNWTGSLILLLI